MSATVVGVLLPAGAVLALASMAWWIRGRYVVVTVEGLSMIPELLDGDRIIVRRIPTDAVRNRQMIVFSVETETLGPGSPLAAELPPPDGEVVRPELPVQSSRWMVKRVIAVPGDPLPEERVPALRGAVEEEESVPSGKLVVLGDNAAHSTDSRHFGYVDSPQLLGVVVRRLKRR